MQSECTQGRRKYKGEHRYRGPEPLPATIFRYPGSPHFDFGRLRLLGHLHDALGAVIDDLVVLLNECRRRDGPLPPRTHQFPSR